MNNSKLYSVVANMQAMSSKARGLSTNVLSQQQPSFFEVLKNQVNQVNQTQQVANQLQDDYLLAKPGLSLPQVMIQTEKASLYTHGLISLRDKAIAAYDTLMNMSV